MGSPVARPEENESNWLTEITTDPSGYVNMLDLKNPTSQQQAMEAFFFGYQAFTAKADEMLERRGLSRVHQRIVFFIARYPNLSVKELLGIARCEQASAEHPAASIDGNASGEQRCVRD